MPLLSPACLWKRCRLLSANCLSQCHGLLVTGGACGPSAWHRWAQLSSAHLLPFECSTAWRTDHKALLVAFLVDHLLAQDLGLLTALSLPCRWPQICFKVGDSSPRPRLWTLLPNAHRMHRLRCRLGPRVAEIDRIIRRSHLLVDWENRGPREFPTAEEFLLMSGVATEQRQTVLTIIREMGTSLPFEKLMITFCSRCFPQNHACIVVRCSLTT